MAKSLEYWRGYFSGSNTSIFDIIYNAVTVAALDYPEDFKIRRGLIAELLFTCNKFNNNSVGSDNGVYAEEEILETRCQFDDDHPVEDVFFIKKLLDNSRDQSDSVLIDSLRRLQLMDFSVEILEVTKIGKSVRGLKKHGSKEIRDLAQNLIQGWIAVVDSFVDAMPTTPIAEHTSPESMKTCTMDFEEGLFSPPLDEGTSVMKPSDEASIKRKLHDHYQDVQNVKKQRTIKVMDLQDIPKVGAGRSHLMKPGLYHHNRQRANRYH